MKDLKIVFAIGIMMLIGFFSGPTYCSQIDGWIKSETCMVVKSPSKDANVVGIIKQKAVVTVEDLGNGWARTISAPVRNLVDGRDGMKVGQLYDCEGCYIQTDTISTLPPGRW